MITIIHGSHRHGIHWEIVNALNKQLNVFNNDVKIIDLSALSFSKCCGNQVCQEGECIYKDDQLSSAFESIILCSDVIYIVTPTYFNMPPAKLKSFIDRTNALLPFFSEANKKVFFGAWVGGEADLESIRTNSNLLREYASIMGWIPLNELFRNCLIQENYSIDNKQIVELSDAINRLTNN